MQARPERQELIISGERFPPADLQTDDQSSSSSRRERRFGKFRRTFNVRTSVSRAECRFSGRPYYRFNGMILSAINPLIPSLRTSLLAYRGIRADGRTRIIEVDTERSFVVQLPEDANLSKLSASSRDGVLTIYVTRNASAEPEVRLRPLHGFPSRLKKRFLVAGDLMICNTRIRAARTCMCPSD